MKRTPIKRKTPLKAKSGLKNNSGLKRTAPRKVVKIDEEWRVARLTVLERDRQMCRAYGVAELSCFGGLHVHHVLPRSRGGKHNPENLVTLCSRHHEWVHGHPRLSKELGLLK